MQKLSTPYRGLVSFKNIFGDKKKTEEKSVEFKNEKAELDNDLIFKDYDAVKNTEYTSIYLIIIIN